MCKHPTEALMGTADGIICRKCGAAFKSFAEIQQDDKKPENAPVEAAEAPKKGRKKKTNA